MTKLARWTLIQLLPSGLASRSFSRSHGSVVSHIRQLTFSLLLGSAALMISKQAEYGSHQGKRPFAGIFGSIKWHRSIRHVLSAIVIPFPGQVGPPWSLKCLACAHSFGLSSLFALSIDNNLLGGYLWVVVMASLAYFSTTISRKISLHSKKTVP